MTFRPTLRRMLALGLALAAACASSGTAAPRKTTTNRATVLTQDEIERANIPNLYDLVSSLRPRWLQTRGVDSFQKPSEIQVYLGQTRMQGGVSALKDIASLGVTRVEFVDGITASARWGLDHGAGAIVVSMSPRP
jgi:hypothetical protein